MNCTSHEWHFLTQQSPDHLINGKRHKRETFAGVSRESLRSCLAIGRRNVHQVVHLKEEVIPTGVVLPSHSQHIPLKHLAVRHELHPNLLVVCFESNSQLEPNGYNYSIAGRFFGLTVLLAWNSSQIQSRSNGKDYISYYHIWSIYLGTLMDVNNCPVGTFLSIGRNFWVWTEFTKIDGISETVQESSEKYMDGNRREKDGTQREMDGITRNSKVSKRMRRKWCGRKKLKWTEFTTEFVWTKTFVHWSSRYIYGCALHVPGAPPPPPWYGPPQY